MISKQGRFLKVIRIYAIKMKESWMALSDWG